MGKVIPIGITFVLDIKRKKREKRTIFPYTSVIC